VIEQMLSNQALIRPRRKHESPMDRAKIFPEEGEERGKGIMLE
jgi:hypothetical protein